MGLKFIKKRHLKVPSADLNYLNFNNMYWILSQILLCHVKLLYFIFVPELFSFHRVICPIKKYFHYKDQLFNRVDLFLILNILITIQSYIMLTYKYIPILPIIIKFSIVIFVTRNVYFTAFFAVVLP